MRDKRKVIAAFDFDGTITKRDTLFDFIRFYKGKKKLYFGLAYLSPILILNRIKLIQNSIAKQILFSYFFKGEEIDKFREIARLYIDQIEKIKFKDTWDKIQWHKENGHSIIIISASIYDWIIPWAKKNKIDYVLATNIEVNNNKISGRFSSRNCSREEKVRRLIEKFPNRDEFILYAYGDSKGDKELLDFSDIPTLYKKRDNSK